MSSEVQESQLRDALASGIGSGNVVVLILPAEAARELFGSGSKTQSADYTLPEYRRAFAPDLSISRIREQCASGHFPDVALPDGTVIRGAYKDSAGQWRITPEGIEERRKRDRTRETEKAVATGARRSEADSKDEAALSWSTAADDSDLADPVEPAASAEAAPDPVPRRGRAQSGRSAESRPKGRAPDSQAQKVRGWRKIRGVG